jgi:hypothetical protein
MMAKMFYTMEEAKATLSKSEEEVKQYAREGRLREFRDGPRLMFKADQVEQLKGDLASGGGGVPDLGVSDSGGLIGLVDTTGASGTSITLSEADTGQSSVAGLGGLGGSASGLRLSGSGTGINLANTGTGMGLSGTGAGGSIGGGSLGGGSVSGGTAAGMSGSGLNLKGDTGLAADLGLSGSLGGVPSPGRPGSGGGTGTGMAMSGTGAGRSGSGGGGINVFGPDEDAVADPGAQTAISGGIREQVNLEGVGSGSGLLDLTRESDDTSLGAVLDEITPGATGGGRRAMADTGAIGSATMAGLSEETAAAGTRRAGGATTPVYVQQMDPMAGAFGGAALGGAIFLLFAIYVLISALVGAYPDATSYFDKKGLLIPFAFGCGVAAVCAVLGGLLGRVARR